MALALALVMSLPFCLRAGDEEGFLAFWAEHQGAVSNHAAASEICTRFLGRTPASAYRPAVEALNAWHALAAGRTNEARAGFAALLSPAGTAPITLAAQTCAQRWLTRLDREAVRKALADWYAAQVAYPESLQPLAALPDDSRPPLKDRWGQAWDYRLERFKRIKGLTDQRYHIESRTLGADSDLARALALPWDSRLHIRAVQLVAETPSPTVEFEFPDSGNRRATLMEGTVHGNVRLARVGPRAILISDGDHWQVLPRPGIGKGAP